ncbi:MAG: hypothetical protein LBC39_07970 [Methanobrevibacter sp.]|jgi:predicted nuclease with TOPRIM domain|nr:hypothetical protein [Candidatus Methanovirga aequatorialis]
MNFNNKKNKNYAIDSKDVVPKSNFETFNFDSLDLIDFNFDNVDSNLDDDNPRKKIDLLKNDSNEKLPDLDFDIKSKDQNNEWNYNKSDEESNSYNSDDEFGTKVNIPFNNVKPHDEFNVCNEDEPFIDVRIITEDLDNAEVLSKSIKCLDLKTDLNIIISSIIPVNNLKIAINAVRGADIVLVTDDYDFDNHDELSNPNNEVDYHDGVKEKIAYYKDELKDTVGYVGILKFPKTRNYELVLEHFLQDEIKKSIMKAGFNSLFNTAKLNQVNLALDLKNKEVFKFSKLNERLTLENSSIVHEYEIVKNENQDLKKEMKILNVQIDELKSEFSDFKDRFSNIHDKDILEIFPLSQLWEDSFNEVLDHENHLVLATNKFKPDNIIIGQGLIGARSKIHAVEWLKVVRTSLIFINNSHDLLEEFNKKNHDGRPFPNNQSTTHEEFI